MRNTANSETKFKREENFRDANDNQETTIGLNFIFLDSSLAEPQSSSPENQYTAPGTNRI
ncbi:hypothetical protein PanWU01x14_083360 [Parasponia andersonii]|uniref:Uncharacterized protein n=1 Tax=Parasponia andersonii TaxID=3476 RepID=A0A2P5DA45_PARAD|nr:hypothetical protein PanWU01x14_083360 [Parasponia andersonii]